MQGMVFAPQIETMVTSVSESHRTSITIQCSARKSKWARRWVSFRIVSEFGKLRIPAVTASLRVKLPQAVFKLSLAVRCSVCKGSSSTVRKTVRFFGLLKTRRVGLRLSGCLRKLNEKTVHTTDTDGTISRKDVQRKKLAEPEQAELQESPQKVSLGTCCLLSRFASEKKRWATGCQVAVVLLALMFVRQLGVARAVWSAAFIMTASVLIGLVLNFFGVTNTVGTEIWKLWEEAASVGKTTAAAQVMRPIVETFSRSRLSLRMLCGTTALFIIDLFSLSPSSWRQ